MTKQERQNIIINLLNTQEFVKISDITNTLRVDRTTAYRDFKEIAEKINIKEIQKGQYALKPNPVEYLKTPYFERLKKIYNFKFLANYKPNKTNFLNEEQLNILHNSVADLAVDTDFYHNNKRLLETILIDLSFASSTLEGNTYDYLDTEVLIKYNEIAKDKSKDDTQMILNHKKCIEYMIWYKKELEFIKQTFYEIHTLLGEKLLPKESLGIIRNKIVEIGASQYIPLDNKFQLEEQFEIFLEKLNEIKNPFEQSVFILVFIPYFQLFLDINKRTSRMISNLPLLKANLPLISLLQVEKKEYITAILAVYELNDTSLVANMFVNNYLLNLNRYK